MSSKPILVISHDVVGKRPAGPGIRYRALAGVLAQHFEVTLAVPGQAYAEGLSFAVWPYRRGEWSTLARAAQRAHVILACGDSLVDFPALAHLGIPLAVDGYDPHSLETLALWTEQPIPVQTARHDERLEILRRQCQAGDFFICASERQRDWWLGLLEDQGRVNPHTYNSDPSLRNLIDVVSFGLPSESPTATQPVLRGMWPEIGPDDRIVLWGGGLWEWLDPLTALRAVRRLADDGYDVRLVFPGTRHPNPGMPDMPMRARTITLADELGLTGRYAFFGDWVPYEDWPAVLLEADIGLSLHADTVEARLAFRSRALDYMWAGLPMVVTQGDSISDIVQSHDLGVVVDYGDEAAVAKAVQSLLQRPRAAWLNRFRYVQDLFAWERVAEPLVEFCRHPHHAADRDSMPQAAAPLKDLPEADPDSALAEMPSVSAEVVPDRPAIAPEAVRRQVEALSWYHTLDLGNGIVTPGAYDHRPYLHYYGLPDDLTGKTALDIGTASGFFAFEMERRGAKVTAIDLPSWFDHDFGPRYVPDLTAEEGRHYLQEPFMVAKQALGSQVRKVEMNIYDISPQTVGAYDLVFCGSLLLHLTDPIRAMWRIRSVTREQAIIATGIVPDLDGYLSGASAEPLASFTGHHRADGWWLPDRACLEAWVQSANFAGWEWVSEFRLDYRDGQPGAYHGVIRAWTDQRRQASQAVLKTADKAVDVADGEEELGRMLAKRAAEITRLQALIAGYERGRFIRLMRRAQEWRRKVSGR